MEAVGVGMGIVTVLMVLVFFVVWLLMMAVGLLALAFWIWMLVDVLTNARLKDTDRIVWVLVVVLATFIGAAIYYFVERPKKFATPPPLAA